MNQVLVGQLDKILASKPVIVPPSIANLNCGWPPLCYVIRGLSISATTVVGVLGRDDLDAFNALVAEIGDESDLARPAFRVGSFSVRFSRRAESR